MSDIDPGSLHALGRVPDGFLQWFDTDPIAGHYIAHVYPQAAAIRDSLFDLPATPDVTGAFTGLLGELANDPYLTGSWPELGEWKNQAAVFAVDVTPSDFHLDASTAVSIDDCRRRVLNEVIWNREFARTAYDNIGVDYGGRLHGLSNFILDHDLRHKASPEGGRERVQALWTALHQWETHIAAHPAQIAALPTHQHGHVDPSFLAAIGSTRQELMFTVALDEAIADLDPRQALQALTLAHSPAVLDERNDMLRQHLAGMDVQAHTVRQQQFAAAIPEVLAAKPGLTDPTALPTDRVSRPRLPIPLDPTPAAQPTRAAAPQPSQSQRLAMH